MKSSVYVDVGGTFTDCVVIRNGAVHYSKTSTTGYNLSVGFMRCLQDAADEIGISFDELLEECEVVCYSTTMAMNTLLQRKGPRLALLMTRGSTVTHILGKGSQFLDGTNLWDQRNVPAATKLTPIIPIEYTAPVNERIDVKGTVLRSLDEAALRQTVDELIVKGVRGFVVCLLNSYVNPVHEQRIRQIITEEYPSCYVGHVPVVLSSETLPKRYEYQRVNATILNAYLHESMADQLRGMGDELREYGYKVPMLLAHNTGGVAEIYRTKAVQTYNGGPVAGLIGSAHVGTQLGYKNIVVSDMGGTSFDLGLVVDGTPRSFSWQPLVERWQVDTLMYDAPSIGAGGGSIAHVTDTQRRLAVGPQSAGSMPGPACYDQGGTEPTVTDADLVLGYLDPDYFHGGRMMLNKERAIAAITDKVAKPLGVDLLEAAWMIKSTIDAKMGDLIFTETVLTGQDPKDFVLFAYGGGGPVHCCGYAEKARIPRIVVFPLSSVFCAYGSSLMDFSHVFELSRHLSLLGIGTGKCSLDFNQFNSIVKDLQQQAVEEIEAEGLNSSDVQFGLELDMRFAHVPTVLRIVSPLVTLNSEEDAMRLYNSFATEYARVYSGWTVMPQLGVDIESFYLRATLPRTKPSLPEHEPKGATPPADALRGTRPVYWREYGEMRDTKIYELGALQCGNVVDGPVVVEAPDTTLVLPPGQRLTINRFMCGEIERI